MMLYVFMVIMALAIGALLYGLLMSLFGEEL